MRGPWVLGTHDVVRIAARSHAGKVHPKLTSLYDRFRLVRVPLAELKIAGDDAFKDGRVMLVHAEEDEAKPEASGLIERRVSSSDPD
jgi:hypothetical protein